MGVYIKGMEMPFIGSIKTIVIYPDGTIRTRRQDPLPYTAVPVPPHGRLIDADEMIGKLIENGKHVFGSGDIPECSSLSIVQDYVESAPTVIEAEEGE